MQEISAPKKAIRGLEAAFALRGARARLGTPDPMAKKAADGIGAVDTCEHTLTRLAPTAGSGPLVDAIEPGRAELCTATLSDGAVVLCYSVYLWQGSVKYHVARVKGDALLQAVVGELSVRKHPLALILGDLNAPEMSYAALRLPLREGRLSDLGFRLALHDG